MLTATLQVLRKGGASALTTTRVAEVAGVSVGTIYQYFPNKRSLVAALKLQYFERVSGRVQAAVQAARGLPIEAALAHIVGELLAAKRDNRAMGLALRGALAELGARPWLRQAAARLTEAVAELLGAAGVERPEAAAKVITAGLEGVVGAFLEGDPEALFDPALEAEMVALACGYLERRRGARAA